MIGTNILYHDPAANSSRSYEDLLADLSRRTRWHKVCRSHDAYEIFVSVLHSVLHHREIILCDAEWSIEERRAIGITASEEEVSEHVGALKALNHETLRNALFESDGHIVFLTSGTTGVPKRVSQSLHVLLTGVRFGEEYQDDIWALAYHPAHIAGIHVFLQAFLNRNAIVRAYDSSADEFHRLLIDFNVTCVSATPTYLRTRLLAGQRYVGVKRVTTGGEKHDPTLSARIATAFPHAKYRNVYSTTETGSLFASDSDVFTVPVARSAEIRIEKNLLLVRKNDAAGSGDVWVCTGDRVDVLNESPLRFRILGRDDDMVNVGGFKVNPSEVEEALRSIDGINDAVVYSVRNSVLGYILAADILVNDDALNEHVIHAALSGRLAEYKIPRVITAVAELSVSRTGKRLRS